MFKKVTVVLEVKKFLADV